MTSGHLPDKRQSTLLGRPGPSARTARIAHELINQLSVLNLIAYNVMSSNDASGDDKFKRDKDTFERAMQEATALAEQLAHYFNDFVEGSETISDSGKVIQLLRSVRKVSR